MSKKLFRSTLVFSALTFVSRVLGLVREIIYAAMFGASAGMDAFLVAFKIPNFMRRLFAEGAFTQAFVPVLSEVKPEGKQATRELVQKVMGTLALIVLVVSLFGMLTSSLWVIVFAPGFVHSPDKFALASYLLKITFPYLLFVSLSALAAAVLNTYNKFAIPALAPILLNIITIGAAVWFSPYFAHPIEAVAWGVVIAGILQFACQLPAIARLGLLSCPRWGWRDVRVRRTIKLMVPVLFGASVTQMSLLMDTLFASFLPTGSVSWLYYSDRLMQFPLGMFGVALSTVVLPHLSGKFTANSNSDFSQTIDWALRLILLVGLPSALGLAVMSGPLLMTLFGHGQFNTFDVLQSQQSLWAFAAGLVFFMALKVIVSAFYAKQDMRTPVRAACLALLVNLVFNAILIMPLAHAGIALATAISSAFDVVLLLLVLYWQGLWRPSGHWLKLAPAIVASGLVMALLMRAFVPNLSVWAAWPMGVRVMHLGLWLVVAIGCYLGGVALLGVRKRDFL